jgi:hypothetical protein
METVQKPISFDFCSKLEINATVSMTAKTHLFNYLEALRVCAILRFITLEQEINLHNLSHCNSIVSPPPQRQLCILCLTLVKLFSSFCQERGNSSVTPQQSSDNQQGNKTKTKEITRL